LIVAVRVVTRSSLRSTSSFSSREVASCDATGRSGSRGPRDGGSVDRVGLAARARDPALLGHHLRRHPHHGLAVGEQVALEPGREVAAVLDRPPQVSPERLPGPPDRGPVALGRGRERLVAQLAGGLVDPDESVGPLVNISTNDNHEAASFT